VRSLKAWGVVVGAAAVVAAAVAVPVVLAGGEEDGSRPHPRAASGALALGDLPVGAEPRTGHLRGIEFRGGGERVEFGLEPEVGVAELVALADGFLLSTTPDETGEQRVHALDADGAIAATWETELDSLESGLSASTDGRLGAFISGGKVVVVEDGGRTATELALPSSELGLPVVAVSVGGTTCAGAGADCEVLVKRWEPIGDDGPSGSTWVARPGRAPVPADRGIADVDAVAGNGLTAGTTEVIEDGDGSCAGVADTHGSVLWTTCKDRLIAFSPDSSLVLAGTSAHFGSGDHELTVLDARTGEERLRLKTAEDVGIFETVWEDDGHLLAVVSEWVEDGEGDQVDQRWAVLRIGLDGSREYAVEPVPGEVEDYDGPLDLPQG
jgi:hypothetical protein